MAHRESWTELATDKLKTSLERIAVVILFAHSSTKAEEAIAIILREGKVEQTKTSQKFGIAT
jgi:hypothetical protein